MLAPYIATMALLALMLTYVVEFDRVSTHTLGALTIAGALWVATIAASLAVGW